MPGRTGYVAQIREHIGHGLLLLPAVTVLIRDDQGRLLVVKPSDRDGWGTVGGMVEPGEDPRQSALREALEETGLTIRITRLVDVVGGREFQTTYANGDRCAYVATVFEARVVGGTLSPDGDEVVDARWVRDGDLSDLELTGFTRSLLSKLSLV